MLTIIYQGVILHAGKWASLSEEYKECVAVHIRITKDGVLEADIREYTMTLPRRIAMVDFYVLPGCLPPWPTRERPSVGDVTEASKEPPGLASSTREIATRLSLEPESQEFSGMISKWIQNCHDDHPACHSTTSYGTIPTRIIDVGSPDGTTAPRICDTGGDLGDYIALSHCWGGRQPLVATKENISSLKAGIPWAELPKTFRDAITVTRGLGIGYIWIDSLCIVQDDAQDWEREAAKMARIYESAYLTIAATAAPNGSEGLFPRNRGHEFVVDRNDVKAHVFTREKRSEDSFLPRRLNTGPLSMDVVEDYKVDGLWPLQKRAWCFQELILSPRVLHFTHSEVVWHCRTKWDCECGAVGLGGSTVRKANAFIQNPTSHEEEDEFATSVRWPEIKAADPSHSWYDIVSVFTSNEITYREDILPALSGTAKRFEQLRIGRYIAGLWEDSFAHDLSWHVPVTDWSSRPHSYLGPSFSWCSCVSRIQWPNWTHDYTPKLEVLELSSKIDGLDPTGKVSGAFAKVRGLMTRAHLVLLQPDSSIVIYPDRNDMELIPSGTTLMDALFSEEGQGSKDMIASSGSSENGSDLTPGRPREMIQCGVIQPRETQSNNAGVIGAGECRLDTVDDMCYASFCCERHSKGKPCDCNDDSGDSFDGKNVCTDKNLVYCLRILDGPAEGDGDSEEEDGDSEEEDGDSEEEDGDSEERRRDIVALILVPQPDTGSKGYKRIGIVYNMSEAFFRDEKIQEVTVV